MPRRICGRAYRGLVLPHWPLRAWFSTQIILHIKPDTETDHYDNFLDEYGIVAIVKKYSDYVRYPIQMERQHERQKPEPDPKPEDYKPEWESYTELETLNSMVP